MPKMIRIFLKFIIPAACLVTATAAFASTSTPEAAVPGSSALAGLVILGGFGSIAFWRQRRQQRLHDLLYMTAAMAWVSACGDENLSGNSHAR